MEPPPAKPPHQKLQNDAAGIEIEFGSIYVIPAPTDYMDDDVGHYDETTPHQLINFGPTQEKVLIIPDYRVTHVVPGVSRKSLINSDQMVKVEKKSEESSSAPSEAVSVSPAPSEAELTAMLSQDFREKQQVTATSPLTTLAKFEGAEGAVLLDMFASWNVTTLQDMPSFPSKQPEGVTLLVETDMFPDVVKFAEMVSFLLANPPPIVAAHVTSDSKAQLVLSSDSGREGFPDLAASQVLSPNRETPKSFPILGVPGVTPAIANILSRYALIETSSELRDVPTKFPGIYAMLKETLEVPNLDELILAASALGSGHVPAQMPQNSGDATKETELQSLGEAQRSTVKIQDISKNTLVGALKSMSHALASELGTQYPPIHSLNALATFAEVSPTEFTYLKRKYPELPELCQQAALLVSVASGHPRTRPL
jgi:hypothetical protein